MPCKYKILFPIIVCLSIFQMLPAGLLAADAVQFELIVRQKPANHDNYVEIMRDTADIMVGSSLYMMIVNMSLDIQVDKVDSLSAEFVCHLTTIGQNPFNIARRFKAEYNLPARITNIPGKNESIYQLLISPRKPVSMDNESCPFATDSGSQFRSSPSANFDYYFLPNSLADFNWNIIKSYLEADFLQFRNAFDLSVTNKIAYYLPPCPLNSVKWDKRFGYAIDPGRFKIYAIYSRDFISSEAVVTNALLLLRFWGHAPPFVLDGLSGYFEFNNYEAKKLIGGGEFPHLSRLMTTSGYYATDPLVANTISGSFFKYLADHYNIGRVKELYRISDDLTLQKNIENLFGKSLDSLENEWVHYLDTVSLTRNVFDYYAARAGALFDSRTQIEYYENMLKLDDSRADSIDTRKKLYMIYYQSGRYYDAEKGYRDLVRIDSSLSIYWQIIGNLNLIIGEIEKAWQAFDSAFSLDTTLASAKLLQAEILSNRGDLANAIEMAEKYYNIETSVPAKIEFLLLIGELRKTRGAYYDSLAAHRAFSDALAWCQEMIAKAPNDPAFKFRAGLANEGLGQYKEADDYLELAWFTEHRTYFLGHILLERGKVNDKLGNRDAALRFYQECLAGKASARHQELCRQYIDKPFSE